MFESKQVRKNNSNVCMIPRNRVIGFENLIPKRNRTKSINIWCNIFFGEWF